MFGEKEWPSVYPFYIISFALLVNFSFGLTSDFRLLVYSSVVSRGIPSGVARRDGVAEWSSSKINSRRLCS